jgi:hypothetical protein
MAHIVRAVRHYGPRVVHNKSADFDEISQWIEARTSLNKSQIVGALIEISEATLFFNRMGSPLRLPRVGIFRPSIDRHGEFKINFRALQGAWSS